MWRTFFRYQKYCKFRQTGSGNAADSKLSYTIQFSVLMLCAIYQEVGLCGSWEKCDDNFFDIKNIVSSVKQEVDMQNISKLSYTIQFSILMLCAKYQEAGLCGSWEKCDKNVFDIKNIVSSSSRKWTCGRFETVIHDTVLHTDDLCQISRSWPVWFLRKIWQKCFRYQNHCKFRQTGRGHAADSKLSYAIQCSILMLCAKYQEASLCGSWEKCDEKLFDIKNIVSSFNQEVDMRQIRNCHTRYSSPYWCFVPNIKKLACVVPQKDVTTMFSI